MMNYFSFLYFCSVVMSARSIQYNPDMPSRCLMVPGDLNLGLLIGYLYNSHHPETGICEDKLEHFTYYSILYYEAFIYAINQINSRSDILPNITLGYAIHDTCWSELGALAKAQLFVPQKTPTCGPPGFREGPGSGGWSNCSEGPQHLEVVGVVDPPASLESKAVSQLLGLYHIPVLSTRASYDELSDKTRYPFFSRLSPPDSMMINVIFDSISYFNWTYISILYPDSPNGVSLAKRVHDVARSRGVCIPVSQRVPFFLNPSTANQVALKLRENLKARVVFNFLIDYERFAIYAALDRLNLTGHFIWLFGDVMIGSHDGPVATGSIIVIPYMKELENFTRYFQAITPETRGKNPWVLKYWEYHFNCTNCISEYWNKTISHPVHNSGASESLYIDAVNVYSHALHALITDYCPQVFNNGVGISDCIKGELLQKYMRNISIESHNGVIKFTKEGDRIGKFSILQYNSGNMDTFTEIGISDQVNNEFIIFEEKINWKRPGITSGHPSFIPEGETPISICSSPCKGREYSVKSELPCCWQCKQCPLNYKLNQNHTTCEPCPKYQWPDEISPTGCSDIEPLYLRWYDPIALILSGVALSGLVLSFSTALWMYKYKGNKLVKACSIHLCGILLFGTALCYVTTITYYLKPTATVCKIGNLMFSLSIGLIFVPLFVKSVRVYRIFKAGKQGKKNVRFVSNMAQIVLTGFLLFIQMGIGILIEILLPSSAEKRHQVPNIKLVELLCHVPADAFIILMTFNFFMIILCAICGILIRKLPDNFNESRFLFISVTTTLFLWLVFIPAYFASPSAINQTILSACCLLFNATVTLVCLFAPKMYAVHFLEVSQVHPLVERDHVKNEGPTTQQGGGHTRDSSN